MTRFSADCVRVATGGRLHLGFYGFCVEEGRALGGVGVAVDGVGYRLEARVSSQVTVKGCQSRRVEEAAKKAVRVFGLPGLAVQVYECIPEHVGLGSTTQLLLAIYTAAALLAGRTVADAVQAARRGPFSGVGTGVFLWGGLVVDTGIKPGDPLSAVPMTHTPMPWGWVALGVLPNAEWRVEEGSVEDMLVESALHSGNSGGCCDGYRALLRLVLPGAALGDFEKFTLGLEALELLAARQFSGSQGGAYCCPESARAAQLLRRLGAKGVGQSSWGPLVYGFYPGLRQARHAAHRLSQLTPPGWKVLLLPLRNQPARVEYC